MCLLIDTNCASKLANGDAEAEPIAKWLTKRTSKITLGGTKLLAEYAKVGKFRALLRILDERGQLERQDDALVDTLTKKLMDDGALVSDDPHIVALATISGTRTLYSNDQALHEDFCSTTFFKPKGRVYQSPDHAHLLNASTCP